MTTDPAKCPVTLTGEQFLAALQSWGQVPRLIADTDDLMGTSGPRISTSGMVPHPSPEGEIHAWVWPDGLCIVSRAIFDALSGK
jgi:hypothetical protein